MAASSSADGKLPRGARRSIGSICAAMVAVLTACLVLLYGLAAFGIVLARHGLSGQNQHRVAELAVLAAAGLVVVIGAGIAIWSFSRRISRDISGLASLAQQLAGQPGAQQAIPGDPKTAETAQAAAAITSLRQTAAAAVASEARLRTGLRQVFVSLARRNQSLLQRQLRLIDALEQKASDPAALADLFSLDHLTTRMRRHAESLAILSGAAAGRSWREPVPMIDVIRGAVGEVEDYKRVAVLTAVEDAVAGSAVADMIHLLAELIENATLFSPSGTRVEVRAGRVANGFAVEVDDRGLGIDPDQLDEINQQLARPPDFDLADADRLGLFVGAQLAARHGVRVSLRPSPYGGTTAIVLMPPSIVVPGEEAGSGPVPAIGRSAQLDPIGPEGLALSGRHPARPSLAVADSPMPGTPVTVTPVTAVTAPVPPIVPVTPAPNGLGGPADGSPPGSGPDAAGAAASLPRRTRQASLSPHLQDGAPPAARFAGTGSGTGPADDRAPERARNLAASLQSGWQRGRQADLQDQQASAGPAAQQASAGPAAQQASAGPAAQQASAGPAAGRRQDSESPHTEEAS